MQNDLSADKKRLLHFHLAVATKQKTPHGVANLVREGASWNLTYCGLCAVVISECKVTEPKNQSFHLVF